MQIHLRINVSKICFLLVFTRFKNELSKAVSQKYYILSILNKNRSYQSLMTNFVNFYEILDLGIRCHVYFPLVRTRAKGKQKWRKRVKKRKKKILVVFVSWVLQGAVSPWSNIFRFFVRGARCADVEGPRSRGGRRGGLPLSSTRCFELRNLTE